MAEMTKYDRSFAFFSKLLKPYFIKRYNYIYDSLHDIEAPFLLLSNHNMDFDPIFLGIAAEKDLCFVASEHILRKGLGSSFLVRFFDPIAHTKGKVGVKTTALMLRKLRDEKRSVALFPEGNRSFNGLPFDIPPATGKLARMSGVKLVTYRIEGGYFTQPRWGDNTRRGKITGHLVRVYEPEELRAMKADEVQQHIIEDLYEDAYESQKKNPVLYRGKDRAEGLESTVFMCPVCKKISTLKSQGDNIVCTCGYKAEFGEDGYLKDVNNNKYSVTQLDSMQKDELKRLLETAKPGEIFFSDKVKAQQIDDSHQIVKESEGCLSAGPAGFFFNHKHIPLSDIEGAAIHSRNTITAHILSENAQYEIKGEKFYSALKYLYLYELLTETAAKAEAETSKE